MFAPEAYHIAVVVAGPSGVYPAEALTSHVDLSIAVDVLKKLPVPFGLVRYGVATDHRTVRPSRDTPANVLQRSNVRFAGGVKAGSKKSVSELHFQSYDAVIFAQGAFTDRRLRIAGEGFPWSISATQLVEWYCGQPDASEEQGLDAIAPARSAVVVGVGNVAVDVVAFFTKGYNTLRRACGCVAPKRDQRWVNHEGSC